MAKDEYDLSQPSVSYGIFTLVQTVCVWITIKRKPQRLYLPGFVAGRERLCVLLQPKSVFPLGSGFR